MSARGVMRTVKNYTKGYSPIQMKVREATSNDPGSPSGALMSEIAQATYNQSDFLGVMEIIDKRLNDKGKNWRHVFKALTVLDFCLHVGSKTVVEYAIDNIFIVKTLREFQHIDDSGRDQGANVRQKAKEVTLLLLDRTRLEKERSNRNWMNNRMGFGGGSSMDYYNNNYASSSGRLPQGGASGSRSRLDDRAASHGRRNSFSHSNQRYNDEDGEMRKAIAESKRVATSKRVPTNYDEDAELKKAIEESARVAKQEEEEKKRKAQLAKPATTGEADLLGGLDDAFDTTGANSSVNNFNNSTMVSTTSFSQQQFGSNSAANDLLGVYGGGAGQMGMGGQFGGMGAASNTGFDPFGLNGAGNGTMNNQMGMNFSSPMGIGGNVNAFDGSNGNAFDNTNMFGSDSSNMFGGNTSSSNHVVTRTTITTTGMAMGGTPNPFGQSSAMMSTPGAGMFDASGMGGQNSNNLFDASGMGAQGNGSASLLGMSGADTSANAGGFNGATGAFGSAFDGGLNAKTLPFGVNPNDPNSKIAEIARNSDRIDPFASLAMGSSGLGGSGGQNNPFGGSSTAGLGGMTPSQTMNASSSFLGIQASTPGNLSTIGSSLVDLSPAALAMTNNSNNSFQSFGQVNRNPFAVGDTSGMGGGAMNAGKQPSLNQLMTGGGNQMAMGGTVGSANVFGQQLQQTPNMMGGFGGMQQTSQQQQQQVTFQQQVNPFAQNTTTMNNNQNTNFFGM
ncbi:hypothetical protein GGI20_001270 [Coemansia sp. BCRC 34301]|nr:hypothetical protein GGI20_001270 [Coemansia sp. BCRC 34301]